MSSNENVQMNIRLLLKAWKSYLKALTFRHLLVSFQSHLSWLNGRAFAYGMQYISYVQYMDNTKKKTTNRDKDVIIFITIEQISYI